MVKVALVILAFALCSEIQAGTFKILPLEIEKQEETVITPEIIPEVIPEVEAVVPEIIQVNPCDACFQYMTTLIEQLSEGTVVEPSLPELLPVDPEVTLPEEEKEEEATEEEEVAEEEEATEEKEATGEEEVSEDKDVTEEVVTEDEEVTEENEIETPGEESVTEEEVVVDDDAVITPELIEVPEIDTTQSEEEQ